MCTLTFDFVIVYIQEACSCDSFELELVLFHLFFIKLGNFVCSFNDLVIVYIQEPCTCDSLELELRLFHLVLINWGTLYAATQGNFGETG